MADTIDFTKMFNGNGVDYNAVDLDPNTLEAIRRASDNALQSQDQIADKMNAGIPQAAGQALQTPEQVQQQAAGTGSDPHMLQAIRNKYNTLAGKDIGSIVRANKYNAGNVQSDWLQKASQMAMAQQNVATQNYEMLTQAYNDAQAARAAVISSVFQVAGAGGGMAASGQFSGGGNKGGQPQQQQASAQNSYGPQVGAQSDMNPNWYNS